MKNDMTSSIELFHRFQAFMEANGITALTPVQVMSDLANEINAPANELYVLATKLIDGIYSSDAGFVYGERIEAIRTIVEDGIDCVVQLNNVSAEQACDYLLHCSTDHFIAIVDAVAKVNQEYYTANWAYDYEHDELMDQINASIQAFQSRSPSLTDQIQSASDRRSAQHSHADHTTIGKESR